MSTFKAPKLIKNKLSEPPHSRNIRGKSRQIENETPDEDYAPRKQKVASPAPSTPKVAVPTHWQRGLAGVSLTKGPGAGEERLNAVCAANGWTWGLVACVSRENHSEVGAIVVVGQLFEGRAEALMGNDSMKPWDAADEALGQIAELLEEQYAGSTK